MRLSPCVQKLEARISSMLEFFTLNVWPSIVQSYWLLYFARVSRIIWCVGTIYSRRSRPILSNSSRETRSCCKQPDLNKILGDRTIQNPTVCVLVPYQHNHLTLFAAVIIALWLPVAHQLFSSFPLRRKYLFSYLTSLIQQLVEYLITFCLNWKTNGDLCAAYL